MTLTTKETTGITQAIQDAIIHEKQMRESVALLDQHNLIVRGKRQEVIDNLIFFTSPQSFGEIVESLLQEVEAGFYTGDELLQAEYLNFLVEMALALRSLLPRWNLLDTVKNGQDTLTPSQVQMAAEGIQTYIQSLGGQVPELEKKILSALEADAAARYKAEQATDPERAAHVLVGSSLIEYLNNAYQELSRGQLRRIAEMRFNGETATELSNDYAAFLQHTLYIGASFATTNPPLVNMALDALPGYWGSIVDKIITANPESDAQSLAKLVTMEVVLAQMRLLRPIFLITEGRMGCVCFQVDPNKHDDAEAMIADALFFYESLRSRLGGGIPNVVFKLPGTQAGLETCRALTIRGIGATITVNFGMFQHIPFAEAIQAGHAIYACLVEMNGRLAFPVRDELLGKLDELSNYDIDEAYAREAAAWAGVVIARRLFEMLNAKNIDQNRSKILIASLRIYQGDDYRGLPSTFPDITEITGASLLSVFPNVRHAIDKAESIQIKPYQIAAPVSDRILAALSHSEIFKQAYYVSDEDLFAEDDDRFKPDEVLTLENEAGVFAWPPVYNTQVEFMESYDNLVLRLSERKQAVLGTSG